MSPLDTGAVPHNLRLVDPLDDRAEPTLENFPSVGAWLRAVREFRGRSLADIASATRIGRSYLAALEEGALSSLPSRPFAIGYVRAYARALGLDEHTAVARFKLESPDSSEPLRAPIGVKHDKPERRPVFLAGAVVVVLAVVGWNIAQRAVNLAEPPAPPLPPTALIAEAPAPQGPIELGAPIPPPPEQTTPTPYITPGLGLQAPEPAAAAPAVAGIVPVNDPAAPLVFEARGPVHGTAAAGPVVVLQAKKRASLIVRGPTGAVHFARQLSPGEAYRAPIGQKLSADVSDPTAFSVYINGQLRGGLAAPQTPLDRAVAEVLARSAPAAQVAVAPAPVAAPPSVVPTSVGAAPAAALPPAMPTRASPPPGAPTLR